MNFQEAIAEYLDEIQWDLDTAIEEIADHIDAVQGFIEAAEDNGTADDIIQLLRVKERLASILAAQKYLMDLLVQLGEDVE